MVNCSFCGKDIPKGTGLMFIKKDAKVLNFCSRKCEKNMLVLKRKARNMPWTVEAKKEKDMMTHAREAALKKEKEDEKSSKVDKVSKVDKAVKAKK